LADEVVAWRDAGVDVVVSMLETREVRELELVAEPALCAQRGIVFRNLPIPDHSTPPSRADFVAMIDILERDVAAGRGVAIHCRAGIGRTGMVAACLLRRLGVPARDLFHRLSRSRGLAMPDTAAQVAWVEEHLAKVGA
jgi:protein-tyrosine phosphatase